MQPDPLAPYTALAYERLVDYYLKDQPEWLALTGGLAATFSPPSRWVRVRRSVAGNIDRFRYRVGHWIAGACPDPDYY